MSPTIGSDDVDGGGLAEVNDAQPRRIAIGASINKTRSAVAASASGHALATRGTRTIDRASNARSLPATRSRCARTSSGDNSGLASSLGSSRSSSIADHRSSPIPGTRSPTKRATASSRRQRAAARTASTPATPSPPPVTSSASGRHAAPGTSAAPHSRIVSTPSAIPPPTPIPRQRWAPRKRRRTAWTKAAISTPGSGTLPILS